MDTIFILMHLMYKFNKKITCINSKYLCLGMQNRLNENSIKNINKQFNKKLSDVLTKQHRYRMTYNKYGRSKVKYKQDKAYFKLT